MSHPKPRSHSPRTLFSVSTRYALLALASLPEDGTYRMARGLAEGLAIPFYYLAKILKRLRQVGILESLTGPSGGFRLARPPAGITLQEVVTAFEGDTGLSLCPLGRRNCRDATPCPFCALLGPAFREMVRGLARMSLRDLPRTWIPFSLPPGRRPSQRRPAPPGKPLKGSTER